MENKTASALILATILYVPPLHAATNSPLTQLSAGDQSPVINANNATFNYGLTETTLNVLLEQHEDRIIKRLLAASGDKKERLLLEKQLKAVQGQKADLKKALEKEIQRRKNADEALAKLHGQLPPARLEEAAKLLQKGDTTAAEQLFEEVVRKEGKAVALAAYQNGQLAEGRLDYAKAMRQYKKAVTLEENNLDYLLAGAKMSRSMADYDQAQEWLEQLLSIKQQEGAADLILSNILKELASLYYFRGFYEKAETLYNRSLKITEIILGEEHPEVAIVLKDMAALYEIQARYEAAESLYKRIQKIVGKPSKRIIPTHSIPPLEEKTNVDSVAAKKSATFSLFSLFSFANMSEQQRIYAEAMGTGAAVGAGFGAAACDDNRAAGAALGGLVGGTFGYFVGDRQANKIDRMDRRTGQRKNVINGLQQQNAVMAKYNDRLKRTIDQYERDVKRNIDRRRSAGEELSKAQNTYNKLLSVLDRERQAAKQTSDPNQRGIYQNQIRQLEGEIQKLDLSIRRLKNICYGKVGY